MQFKDLQVEDFPGLNPDPYKFEEWKEAKDTERRYAMVLYGLMLLFFIAIYLFTGDLFTPGLFIILVVPWIISRKPKQLSKELGITTQMYADAWKRRSKIIKSGS